MSGERQAILVLRASGAAVLLLSVAMLAAFPASPAERNVPGFTSPVVGFELATTPEEVLGILGHPGNPARAAVVERMNRGNRIDFLFMIAYPALYIGIVLLLRARGRLTGSLGRVAMLLPGVMWLGDVLENRELLALAALTDPAAMAGALARLRPCTLVKWHALFAMSILVAYPIWKDRSWWRWAGPVFGAAGSVGLASVLAPPATEIAAYLLSLGWLATWAYALRA
ncbi:MAG: hypothetical protein B6D46_09950 [Polyangiaceae bacterium UTPRO1]|jgi:hypothetical protein|nr:hypothetical protein [Myxococcales bacterium]OQY66488.1 MAG: hypothetical protein B6D46_09950 [Polyangiaceae bacterium UTPRO1]